MDELFVVAWSGGYEAPSYVVKKTKDEALAQALEWWKDSKQDEGDTVDILRIDLFALTIERVEYATP